MIKETITHSIASKIETLDKHLPVSQTINFSLNTAEAVTARLPVPKKLKRLADTIYTATRSILTQAVEDQNSPPLSPDLQEFIKKAREGQNPDIRIHGEPSSAEVFSYGRNAQGNETVIFTSSLESKTPDKSEVTFRVEKFPDGEIETKKIGGGRTTIKRDEGVTVTDFTPLTVVEGEKKPKK